MNSGPQKRGLAGSLPATTPTVMTAVLKRIAEEQGLRLDFRSTLRGYVWSATLTRD